MSIEYKETLGYFKINDDKSDEVKDTKYEYNDPISSINLQKNFDRETTIDYIRNFTTSLNPLTDFLTKRQVSERPVTSSDCIISYRSCLRQILITPCSTYKWEANVYKKNGCLYISEDYEPKYFNNVIQGIHNNLYFKKYCCGMDTEIYEVNKWNMGELNLIIASFIDGVHKTKNIKTKVYNQNILGTSVIQNKFVDLWSQCYLGNCKYAICGFYNHNNKIVKIKKYNQNNLIFESDRKKCIKFLVDKLLDIYYSLKDDESGTIKRVNGDIEINSY